MIILLGVPGSGKSTQGQMLVERGSLRWISMGEILRSQINDARKEKMLTGKLLGDKEVIEILKNELQQIGDKPELVLDGFPRSVEQAEWLLSQNSQGALNISATINLTADKSVVEKRLLLRGRADDQAATISNRFDIYERTFNPVIKTLRDGKIQIIDINADQTPEAINRDIVAGLQKAGIEA